MTTDFATAAAERAENGPPVAGIDPCVACGGPTEADDWDVAEFARAYPVGAEAMEWNCSPDGLGWDDGHVCRGCAVYWGT